jgi:hypothetical protein
LRISLDEILQQEAIPTTSPEETLGAIDGILSAGQAGHRCPRYHSFGPSIST